MSGKRQAWGGGHWRRGEGQRWQTVHTFLCNVLVLTLIPASEPWVREWEGTKPIVSACVGAGIPFTRPRADSQLEGSYLLRGRGLWVVGCGNPSPEPSLTPPQKPCRFPATGSHKGPTTTGSMNVDTRSVLLSRGTATLNHPPVLRSIPVRRCHSPGHWCCRQNKANPPTYFFPLEKLPRKIPPPPLVGECWAVQTATILKDMCT